MAEIGLAASLIGITTFGIKLTHHLYDFGATASSAREQTDYIARHVTLYSKTLDLLRDRLKDDHPIHSQRALDLVEELSDQSYELFYKIRDLLPKRRPRDDLSFMKKIAWNFKRSKVDLLVGEIDYLKSTVHLLIDVLYAGKTIHSYNLNRDASRADAEEVRNQCLKAQNAMVEQTNAREKLPGLQAAVDKDEDAAPDIDRLSLKRQTENRESSQTLALALKCDSAISVFQNSVRASLRSVDDPSERRAVILHSSMNWLRSLLDEWTTLTDESVQDDLLSTQAEERHKTKSSASKKKGAPQDSPQATSRLRQSGSFKEKDRVRGSDRKDGDHQGSSSEDSLSEMSTPSSKDKRLEWTKAVFRHLPATKVPDRPNEDKNWSQCYLIDHRDGRSGPGPEFYELLKLTFQGHGLEAGLRVRYFVIPNNLQSGIACEWYDSNKDGTDRSFIPLDQLHSRREHKNLFLCRAVPGVGGSVAWASLYFETIEFLVVFHCTFLALRAQCQLRTDNFDRDLKGEKNVFSGAIHERGSYHALRVYRDRLTGAIRLEASILKGPKEGTPVWTAWITEHIGSTNWMRRSAEDGDICYLTELQQHIFSSEYSPSRWHGAELVLDFVIRADVQEFEDTIADLRKQLP